VRLWRLLTVVVMSVMQASPRGKGMWVVKVDREPGPKWWTLWWMLVVRKTTRTAGEGFVCWRRWGVEESAHPLSLLKQAAVRAPAALHANSPSIHTPNKEITRGLAV
jgi:hypothetical protein